MASSGGRPRLLGFTFPIRPLDHGFVVFEKTSTAWPTVYVATPVFSAKDIPEKRTQVEKKFSSCVSILCAEELEG
jgi:hypothetical protein